MTDQCPICRQSTREFCRKSAYDYEWVIRRCEQCGHGFVSNRPNLEQLAAVYEQPNGAQPARQITAERLERQRGARSLADRIARLSTDRGAALDVGCGSGGFSYHLAKHGYGPMLLNDFDHRAAEATRLIPNSTFQPGPFEELDATGPFSAIVMSQVLEHTLDPLDWLNRARALLGERGVVAVALPNFSGVYRMLGSRDPFIIPPRHLNYFTPRSLRMALEQCGLHVLAMDTRSDVRTATGGRGVKGAARAMAGAVFNAVSWPLDFTMRGIILRAFAGRS